MLDGKTRSGLFKRSDNAVTTKRIEAYRARTEKALGKLGKKRARPPAKRAYHMTAVAKNAPAVNHEQDAKKLHARVARVSEPTAAVAALVQAYQVSGRRVIAVAGERTEREVRETLSVSTQSPRELARRLAPQPLLQVAGDMRHYRWRSLKHMEHLHRQLRAPELRLRKDDVVVLDTRHADQRAVRDIALRARKAGATVVLISDTPPPEPTRSRERGR